MLKGRIRERINGYAYAEEGRRLGLYLYFREIISELDTEVLLRGDRKVLMLGSNSYMGLTNHPEVKEAVMGTFSKSLASLGGFIAAESRSIEFLKHNSRAFIFSASMPPSAAASALAALRIIRREPERIDNLWKNTRMITEGLKSLGYDTGLSETPIIPVYLSDPVTLMRMCKRLDEEGIFVNPVLPPAVQPNRCLLRVSLMATHTPSQITFALDRFEKVGKELSVI